MKAASALAGLEPVAREPRRVGMPSTFVVSFTNVGTPAKAPASGCPAAAVARSNEACAMAARVGSTRSARAMAARVSSAALTSPSCTLRASSTAS